MDVSHFSLEGKLALVTGGGRESRSRQLIILQ
jgi:hypothetical protein